jgi:Ser/Thr protein kinase RdoA (MazF antagonist)
MTEHAYTGLKTVTDEEMLEAALTPVIGPFRHVARSGGYSNRNYSITTAGNNRYSARIARSNRTQQSVLAEETILHTLAQFPALPVPRLVQLPSRYITINNTQHFLHCFTHINGSIPCLWWQQCSPQQLQQLFSQLALLHRAMRTIAPPAHATGNRVAYRLPEQPPAILASTDTGRYVTAHWPAFIQSATRLQQAMQARFPWQQAQYQWIHGDMQTENALFENNQLTALLDFEMVSWDACEKDVILSAFRTCKEGNTDAPFQYNATNLQLAISACRQEATGLCPAFFTEYDALWKPYFCLDQAMLYLRNAFDGVWQLQPGIGFLPCFHEVLQYA